VAVRSVRRSILWLAILFCAAVSLAQTAEVTHNVNLRSDPSTDNPPIRLLKRPENVELLEFDVDGW
jgi:uncharacterized protein YraI